VPGQRRLAISRLRVPNLDGFVATTAGNLISIGAPRHRIDPECRKSGHKSTEIEREKLKGKEFKKNNYVHSRVADHFKKKTYELECPVSVDSQTLHFQIFHILINVGA